MLLHTDNGHPERDFFQKFETFGLGQTNWAEILGGILAISSQTIGTILASRDRQASSQQQSKKCQVLRPDNKQIINLFPFHFLQIYHPL